MRIEKLPFYWRLKERGSPNIVPDHRPFEFDFVEALQLIIQKRDSMTLDFLEEIYRAEYNIGYLQDGNEIAKPYGTDFMSFIDRSLELWGKHVRSVLEVGCGGCAMLSQLQQKGFSVIGVDPSPIAAKDGERKGVRVVNEFFPSDKFSDKVDLIFHSDVQEHVADPVTFLAGFDASWTISKVGMPKGSLNPITHGFLEYIKCDLAFVVNRFRWGSLGVTFDMDEEGLADALVAMGGNTRRVLAIFEHLDDKHNSDADDVAVLYVQRIQKSPGLSAAVKADRPLTNLLVKVMDEGWTSNDEKKAIAFLQGK